MTSSPDSPTQPPPPTTGAPAHIGTSSWSFDGWKGAFYPEGVTAKGYLAHYVTQFDTVEVNTSFYALPRPSTLIDWADAAPEGFTYALKTPRAITHDRKLVDAEADMLAFVDAVRSLGPAAAPALLQLPPDLTRATHGRALAAFLDWLAPRIPELRLVVEVRAQDLMTAGFATFLAERGFALALVERTHNPPVELHALWQEVVEGGAAPSFAYMRWIGDDRDGPQGDDRVQFPRPTELATWAQRIDALSRRGITCYGYAHNPFEGHAPATARSLRALLAQAGVPVFEPGSTGQLPLFDAGR
jgi:uncharacterized protein YecE (DUF72 family)